jgi:hypothetical protein
MANNAMKLGLQETRDLTCGTAILVWYNRLGWVSVLPMFDLHTIKIGILMYFLVFLYTDVFSLSVPGRMFFKL